MLVEGCGLIQRAYTETATNGGASWGVTRAAAIVPIPLTAISSSAVSLIGLTCLNHSTRTRSDSFTTIGHLSYRLPHRPSNQREFHPCESGGPEEGHLLPQGHLQVESLSPARAEGQLEGHGEILLHLEAAEFRGSDEMYGNGGNDRIFDADSDYKEQ